MSEASPKGKGKGRMPVVFIAIAMDQGGSYSPHLSPGGEMITQRFGSATDFTKEWNNLV